MPAPMMSSLEGSAGSKRKRSSKVQTLDDAGTEPRSRALTNRSSNATFLRTQVVPDRSRKKRPAGDPNWSESNKRHRGSPRTAEDPEIQITAIRRKDTGAFDDYSTSAPSTPRKSSNGSPSGHKRIVPGTEPVRPKRKIVDLTTPGEVIDLTGDDEPHTRPACPQEPIQAPVTRQVLGLDTTPAFTSPAFATPCRASHRAPSHNHGLPNAVPKNDLALDLPQPGAISQGDVFVGPETRSQRRRRQNSASKEALAGTVSHGRPAPVFRGGGIDPSTPQRNAPSDRIVTLQVAQVVNTNERLNTAGHLGGQVSNIISPPAVSEASSAPKSPSDDVFLEDRQPLNQDRISDDSSVDDSDDDSDDSNDGEYTPCKPSRRSHARGPLRVPRDKPKKVVILKAKSEKVRQLLVRTAQRPELPIGDKCFFLLLPLEVRQRIYRYLLLARGPIQVLNGWSRLSRLQKREGLRSAILSVSRPIFDQAMRVLYAENVFQYKVRDTTEGGVVHIPSSRTIAVEKYGRYFRRLELHMEGNRTEPWYGVTLARALGILTDNGASLHKLTINVSPRIEEDMTVSMVDWFEKGGQVNIDLKALRTSFIHIHLSTPRTDSEMSKTLRCIIDKRSEVSELEIYQRRRQQGEGSSSKLSEEEARDLIQDEQANKANSQLDQLSSQISMACRSPELAMEQKWFEQSEATWGRPDYSGQEGGDNLNDGDYIYEDAGA